MLTVKEIYATIDAFAPFASQESWDNSGLLVGDMEMPVQRILTALDISEAVLVKAAEWGAQLIVSHHPVIFSPLKKLPAKHPVYQLAAQGMAAICVHTPLDLSSEGLNASAYALLRDALQLAANPTVLEETGADGSGIGWIAESGRTWTPNALARQLEETLGCTGVRYSAKAQTVQKIAYCSGSGASLLELAAAKGCDALITGDIKHDRWYAAEFAGLSLFDCGHYGTERMAAQILQEKIQAAHPTAEVLCWDASPLELITGGEKQ